MYVYTHMHTSLISVRKDIKHFTVEVLNVQTDEEERLGQDAAKRRDKIVQIHTHAYIYTSWMSPHRELLDAQVSNDT